MTLLSPTPRARGRKRVDSLALNARGNRSPTRSQRKEDRIPKKHYNIFDQTLLPEEDFSGGKLLRKRKTSGSSDSPGRKKRKTSSSTSLVVPPQSSSNPDEIEVTSRPRIPHRPVSQLVTALQRITTPPPPVLSSSQIATTASREFRVRDKSINYTIPSLKSLLPTPPHKRRRSPAPHLIQVPKIRTLQSQQPPSLSTPKRIGRPKLRTIIQRNGEKMLLIKLRIASNKLAPLINKPRIRIVENTPGRKRRIRENEEPEIIEPKREPEKPFGGILTKEDADTSKTTPTDIDRTRFDRARETALTQQTSITVARSASEVPSSAGGYPAAETAFKIRYINFGNYRVKTHYASPYPEEYSRQNVLGICEFCLKYMSGEWVGWRHRLKCPVKHPPGDEIYRDGKISIFEVDGRKNPVYCQNLCLLAKMYLDHKTLYYDVEPFLFYVLCECDNQGCHFVGYFSKEKRSVAGYNLSCIVTLPIYQRKGYGFFLISFSYLLSLRENRLGSPEKPLSDLGLLSYRSYWKTALANALLEILDGGANISIQELGRQTGMTDDDVVSGLEGLDALVKDPQTGVYAIKVNREKLMERAELVEKKGYMKVKEEMLKWTPYLLGRKEARDMLQGGLEDLILQRSCLDSFGLAGENAEEVEGKDIPVERFVSVAVRDLVPPPRITYDTTEPQTPAPTDAQLPSDSKSVSTSSAAEEDPLDDGNITSPSAPSSPSVIIDEDISDEPFSAEEDFDEEEMSDYISDDSNDLNTRNKRLRLNRSNRSSPKIIPEVVVRMKQVAKAPKNRAAAFGTANSEVKKPKVIVAKAPRSRAGRNPPEVMSRRTSLRKA